MPRAVQTEECATSVYAKFSYEITAGPDEEVSEVSVQQAVFPDWWGGAMDFRLSEPSRQVLPLNPLESAEIHFEFNGEGLLPNCAGQELPAAIPLTTEVLIDGISYESTSTA